MTNQEINEAVAKKLGCVCKKDEACIRHADYCGDIRAAWEIVEKERFSLYPFGNKWICAYSKQQGDQCHFVADTAPMAICLAFLKLP